MEMKIDFHNHYYQEEYLRYLEKGGPKIELKKEPTGRITARLFDTTVSFFPLGRFERGLIFSLQRGCGM